MKPDASTAWKRFASRADEEPPPSTDVADRVLATLRSRGPSSIPTERDYFLFGAGALVAAGLAFFTFQSAVEEDSLLSFAQPFFTVLP